jgi:MFS family permease
MVVKGRANSVIAIQTLDGVANAIFGIVSILVVKDRTQGTGRFNTAAGSLATVVGIGAAASTTVGGMLIQPLGYRVSFLGLTGIALLAFALLWLAVPETLARTAVVRSTSAPDVKSTTEQEASPK